LIEKLRVSNKNGILQYSVSELLNKNRRFQEKKTEKTEKTEKD
jgi:hypothetical protein